MSRSVNKVILLGNLGQDPEIRTTTTGTKVATVSLATSRSWMGGDGQKQEKTEWHRLVLWNGKSGKGLASIAEQYLKKGATVYVEGSIEYGQYKDKDGVTRYTTEIRVADLQMVGGKRDGAENSGSGRSSSASSSASSAPDAPESSENQDDDLPF